MTPVQVAEQALREGDLERALKSLQDGVRTQPADAKLRVFLFQLLCVLGQWQRAATQLEVCGELDASTLAMVGTYREALKCELLRESVFAGKNTPIVFGQPQPWVAPLIEALQADARGDSAAARRLRDDAFEAAPASPGTLNGERFEWIADADSRLGPVLEAVINGRYCWMPFAALAKLVIEPPADLRDLVWTAAQLKLTNGGELVALLPTRYAGTAEVADSALRLARRTDWLPLAPTDLAQFRGLGQRVFATSGDEIDMLQLRELVFDPVAAGRAADVASA